MNGYADFKICRTCWKNIGLLKKNVKSEFEVESGNAKVVTVKPGSNTDDKLVSNVDVVNV